MVSLDYLTSKSTRSESELRILTHDNVPDIFLLLKDDVVEKVTGAYFLDPNLDLKNLGDLEEDSPYPEVRSAVANTDDPNMPCSTIRAWILGIIMSIIIAGLNQFL